MRRADSRSRRVRCAVALSAVGAVLVSAIAVGQDDALLVECKWTSRPIGVDILHNLERKASLVSKELGSRRLYYGLCARSGFTPQVEEEGAQRDDLFLFDLPRIVEAEKNPVQVSAGA